MLYSGIRTLPPLFTNGMLPLHHLHTSSLQTGPLVCLSNHSALLQQSLRGSVGKPTVDPMRIELTTISLQGNSASLGTCGPRIPTPESNRSTYIQPPAVGNMRWYKESNLIHPREWGHFKYGSVCIPVET